jgi:hydrogenase/urease accessory protein HupE
MFTASGKRAARWILLAAGFLWMSTRGTDAHPVAQGGLLVTISSDHVTLRITSTLEEVLVASADARESGKYKSSAEAAEGHGSYLLKHFRLFAEGRRLTASEPPRRIQDLQDPVPTRFVYEFIYRLDKPAADFRIEEDVLNEFEFAPGNRWEASYVVQINEEGHAVREGLLLASRQPVVFARDNASAKTNEKPRLDRWQVFRDYFHHGLLHILTGYDHLLFITALVLSVRSLWELVKVVSAFTLAHSITLALSAFDLFRLSSSVVEPMIAASIVFVALQNVLRPEQTHGWSRLAVAFFFGLFHGLGFAGGLLEAMQGMSSNSLVVAIVGFSIGVEFGHQVVVVPTFCALKFGRGWWRSSPEREKRALFVTRCGSGAISVAGMVYLGAALQWW